MVLAHRTRPSVQRQIVKDGRGSLYIVNERAPSLSMVARDLYGDRRMAGTIAAWNSLGADAKLHLGQKLRLKQEPSESAETGTAILIKWWGLIGNVEMIMRLGGGVPGMKLKPTYLGETRPLPAAPRSSPTHPAAVTEAAPAADNGPAAAPEPAPAAPQPTATPAPPIHRIPSSMRVECVDMTQPPSKEPKSEEYWLGEDSVQQLKDVSDKLYPETK